MVGRQATGLGLGLAVLLALFAAAPGRADPPAVGPETQMPLPRYVSLNAGEINVRRGPGTEYRIDWMFRRPGLPVRVVDEYGHWRRVEDHEGVGGWVFHALISGRRTAVVTAEGVLLRARPVGPKGIVACDEVAGPGVAQPPENARACAERGVVARLLACQPVWCEIEAEDHRGWVPKAAIWGADPDEVFER